MSRDINKHPAPAYIRWYGKVNGQDRRASLRSGAKGRGHEIMAVWYWPHSPQSVEATYRMFHEAAENRGYEIIGSDRYEQE